MTRDDTRARATDDLTVWDRVAHTPLRDAVRGDWKRRPTVVRILQEASLSPGIVDLIQRIIREARLWHHERLDVARELAAHFADGRDAGRTDDELIATFGDPAQAARLIRAAKKRNRPLWWRASRNTLRATAAMIAVLVVFYAALAIRFFAGSPTISHDYLVDVNRVAAAVPEDQRGWPLYRQAILALEDLPVELMSEDASSGEPLSDQYVAYLERNADALNLLRQAASKPNMGFVVDYTLSEADEELWPGDSGDPELGLFAAPLPFLATHRLAARILNADAIRAADEGDTALALHNIECVLRMAQHIREHPFIISDLVALAIYTTALDTVGALLETHSELFAGDDLTSLAHTLAASLGGDVRVRLEGERLWFRDFLQRAYTDDGRGGGRLTPQGVRLWSIVTDYAAADDDKHALEEFITWSASPAAGMFYANRRDMLAMYEELLNEAIADAALPLWERSFAVDRRLEVMKVSLFESRYMPITYLFPALTHAIVRGDMVAMRRDGVLVAIALELYRRRHGVYPDSLAALTPQFLPQVPPDRFDGQPVRFVVRDGRAIVYSVGTNREDNGGNPPPGRRWDQSMRWMTQERIERQRAHGGHVLEGDAILWPRRPVNWEHLDAPDSDDRPPHVSLYGG